MLLLNRSLGIDGKPNNSPGHFIPRSLENISCILVMRFVQSKLKPGRIWTPFFVDGRDDVAVNDIDLGQGGDELKTRKSKGHILSLLIEASRKALGCDPKADSSIKTTPSQVAHLRDKRENSATSPHRITRQRLIPASLAGSQGGLVKFLLTNPRFTAQVGAFKLWKRAK